MSEWIKSMIARGYVRRDKDEMMTAARASQTPRETGQVQKRQSRFTYVQGPMFYLGQQIVKAMEDAGCPAKILYCYRSADEQARLYAQGRSAPGSVVTKAQPYQSAHQFSEAVDIIHPARGWDVSEDYWATLAACVRTVAQRFGVKLDHGHHWKFRDSAHVELVGWRERYRGVRRVLTAVELWARFHEVLPSVAKRYEADHMGPPYAVATERAMQTATLAVESWRAEADE